MLICRQGHLVWATLARLVSILAIAALGCTASSKSDSTVRASLALGSGPTQISPLGATASTSVTFNWNSEVEGPTADYLIWVTDGTFVSRTAPQAGCDVGTNCTSGAVTFNPGSYDWYIRQDGGTWAGPMQFTVPGVSLPPAPTSMAPAGTASTSQTFSWLCGDADATAWRIWTTEGLNLEFNANDLGCAGGGTCTTPAETLGAGTSASWYVSGQNATGWSPWAGPVLYTVAGTPVPPAPTALSPVGTASVSQVFSWVVGETDATVWQIWNTEGLLVSFNSSDLGCAGGGTCTTLAQTLGAGTSVSWYVSGQNATGRGPWAGPAAYTVAGIPVPSAPTALSPAGAASTSQVFSWLAGGTDATEWRIWMTTGLFVSYTADELGCSGSDTCTTPPVTIQSGSVDWYVSGRNTTGWGPWAGPATITASASVPPDPACEVDGDGDGVSACADCDDQDSNNWTSCGTCVDLDADGYFAGCDSYATTIQRPDCNDQDANNWTSCGSCVDLDADSYFADCDRYVTIQGPDCNDQDTNNWASCSTCVDVDTDGFFVGCNRYSTISGPDCADTDNRAGICAKNVILFVGDGMGFNQVRAGRCFHNGNTAPFAFEALPRHAQMTTASASSSVTDSAASATAMATGHKVNNNVISVALPGNGADLQTVLELRKARGQSTGLITIYDSIVEATPAAFGAHATSRTSKTELATDLSTSSKPNILFGKSDTAVVSSSFVSQGYTYVTSEAGLLGLSRDSVQSVLGIFNDTSPTLPVRTTVALDILEEDADGFFLMVEQANTDKEGHNNNLAPVVAAVVELNSAVQAALTWAAGRTDTLIVVLADHETGGLNCSIADYVPTTSGVVPTSLCSYTTTQHTGVNVPVFATGVGAEVVAGTIDNTNVYSMLAGYGL